MDRQSSTAVPTTTEPTITLVPSNTASNNASSAEVSSSRVIRTRASTSQGDLSAARRRSDKASLKGSKDSLKPKVEPVLEEAKVPSTSDKLLDLLQTELKSIRELITCKICYSPLYEPYTTSCGHTFCYNCFCKTFEPHKPKNCPECRTSLHTQPVPAFTLRAITRQLIKRPELLVEDETLEGHVSMVEEHEQLVKNDREGARGLFHGLFRNSRHICPCCAADMSHGACMSCGYSVYGDDDFSDQESYGYDGLSEVTVSDDQDEDFDMEDADHGFDDEHLEGYDEDIHGFAGYNFDEEEPIPLDQHSAMIHRYLADMGRVDPSLATYTPASHSMAGSRTIHRRSYAPSTVSDYHDAEMNTVLEEEEDEDEGDYDSTLDIRDGTLSPISASQGEAVSNDDMSEDSQASSEQDISASDEESVEDEESPVGTTQFRTALDIQREYSSTASNRSSIASSGPIPIPSRSTTGTPSRRRQRESNTPTSSIGQPRQRRRIGSVINLASLSSQQESVSSRQSSMQPDSTSDTPSVTSENGDDASDESSSEDTANGYVSLDDETGEEDSDGAETTVGWEEATSPPALSQQSQRSETAQTPTSRSLRIRQASQHSASPILESSASTSVQNRQSTSSRESSVISAAVDNVHVATQSSVDSSRATRSTVAGTSQLSTISATQSQSSGTADTDATEIQRHQRISQTHINDPVRSMFDQVRQGSNNARIPWASSRAEPPRDSNRTPGNGYNRPRSVNRSRNTTPSQANVPSSPNRSYGAWAQQVTAERAALFEAQRQALQSVSSSQRAQLQSLNEPGPSLSLPFNASPVRNRNGPAHFISPGIFATLDNFVERADSRSGPRPPSATGRRTPLGRPSLGSPAQNIPGLNTARNWQTSHNPGNPFRSRPSRRQLNSQNSPIAVRPTPSIASLRSQASRGNMRNGIQPVANRPPSRTQSRNQPRSLNHTPSMIHLPQSEAVQQANPRSRVTATMADDIIGRRINNAMDERAALIASARRQNVAEDVEAINRLAPIQNSTNLQALRITSTNPFRDQQANAGNIRPPPGLFRPPPGLIRPSPGVGINQGSMNNNYTSNLASNLHGQRLTPRRSRGNLAHGPPPGIIFSTNNTMHNSAGLSTLPANEAPTLVTPRLNRQRSRGMSAADAMNQAYTPITTMHHPMPQDRWGGPRTQLGAAAGNLSLRPGERIHRVANPVPRA